MKGSLNMNRMEMFVELKKDTSKRFKGLGLIFLVDKDGDLAVEYPANNILKVTQINFKDDTEYTEIEKPFKDRIKDGDVYYIFTGSFEVDSYKYNGDDFDKNKIATGNFFESKEECEEAIRKIKEVLKG